MSDTLLDLDVSLHNGIYRISRLQNGTQRVVYVYITNIEFIVEGSRTSKEELLRDLAGLNKWYDDWDTLTVYESGEVKCNAFKPHGLSQSEIHAGYPLFNILDLKVRSLKKSRVRVVQTDSTTYYLKIARFKHELAALRHEIHVYIMLKEKDPTIAPAFVGYAYEGTTDRVIGFILEAVPGRRASIADLEACESVIRRLHRANIIHGDLLRDNILVTDKGVKLIDFENAYMDSEEGTQGWDRRKTEELDHLVAVLSSKSEVGKPWDDEVS